MSSSSIRIQWLKFHQNFDLKVIFIYILNVQVLTLAFLYRNLHYQPQSINHLFVTSFPFSVTRISHPLPSLRHPSPFPPPPITLTVIFIFLYLQHGFGGSQTQSFGLVLQHGNWRGKQAELPGLERSYVIHDPQNSRRFQRKYETHSQKVLDLDIYSLFLGDLL